jgi:flagellar L-ring protein precursor FlgH
MVKSLFCVRFTAALCLFIFVFTSVSYCESLWKADSTSLYSAQRTVKEGDIITMLIIESSSALSSAGTDTGVRDDLSLKLNYTLQQLYSGNNQRNEGQMKAENKYYGTGKTTRASNIQAKISAVVTRVLSNGNLVIVGKHVVTVNDERQEIKISGVIRAKDITPANTVYSFQVAEANIEVLGEGTVADAESPGWFTRIFNWLF